MLKEFCAPSKYIQGKGASEHLALEIARMQLGKGALILAGRSARKHLDKTWKRSFKATGLSYDVLDFGGECSRHEIDKVKAAVFVSGASVIVAAGGGKVIDTARAAASDEDLPVVVCPTVASSDAPCSKLSVLYSDDGVFDSYLFFKRNPDLVLVDSSMVAKAPARLLVAGMGDALATWFEARAVREACKKNQVGGYPTVSATSLAKLCYETLLENGAASIKSLEREEVDDALERVIEANTLLSGLGFESGGLAVAHSVHNGLTTIPETHDFYHGEKVSFGTLVQIVLEKRADEELKQVLAFCNSVGLPVCLEQVGIVNSSDEIIERIAKRTVAPGETAHNEPFPVNAEMVAAAIVEADKLGRQSL